MTSLQTTKRPITRTDVFSYSMGSFGTGVFSTVPSVLLLYFCTETLRISAAIAAAIMLGPKLWSIIWDPLVGNWSDNSQHPWGRRRPFMVAGNVGMVAAFVMLFSVPVLSPVATILWVGLAYFALATLYSLFAVPYIAIPAEISSDQASVSRLVSGRMIMVMVGILAGAAGAPLIISLGGGGRSGYNLMGWLIGGACLVIMAVPVWMMRDRDRPATVVRRNEERQRSLFVDMQLVWSNYAFRRLALAYFAQATSFGAFSAIIPYLVTKGMGRPESDIGLALGIYLIATIVALPFWSWLGKRIGLVTALIWAVIGYAAGAIAIGIGVLTQVDWNAALIGMAFAGVPFAGLQVLPFTLVGEVIRASGADAEGRFTGIWTAVEKIGLSLGPASVGIMLGIFGTDNVSALGLFVFVMPPTCLLLSLAPFRKQIG